MKRAPFGAVLNPAHAHTSNTTKNQRHHTARRFHGNTATRWFVGVENAKKIVNVIGTNTPDSRARNFQRPSAFSFPPRAPPPRPSEMA